MARGTNFLCTLNFIYRVILQECIKERRENWHEIVYARCVHIDTAGLLSGDINIIY